MGSRTLLRNGIRLSQLKLHALRNLRRASASLMGPVIFHENVDANGRVVQADRFIERINQWLIENGHAPPWVMTREECLEFWRTRSNDSSPGNRPVDYARKPVAIAEYLHGFCCSLVPTDSTILEIGCNAGSNLDVLRRLGYRCLAGLEVNELAALEMQTAYPELYRSATLYTGSAEEILRALATGSFDVVFTMAVAMHIHPCSNDVFAEMVRIARRYICTIEHESANCGYVFARNYQRVFSRLGCRQVKSEIIMPESALDRAYWGCTARLFEVAPGLGQTV